MTGFEWDLKKAAANLQKHRVSFADAVAVFNDESALTVVDDFEEEERWVILGMDAFARLLIIVYTWRGENIIRLISARRATPNERKHYLDQ